jgi:hypothetical protein
MADEGLAVGSTCSQLLEVMAREQRLVTDCLMSFVHTLATCLFEGFCGGLRNVVAGRPVFGSEVSSPWRASGTRSSLGCIWSPLAVPDWRCSTRRFTPFIHSGTFLEPSNAFESECGRLSAPGQTSHGYQPLFANGSQMDRHRLASGFSQNLRIFSTFY